MVYSSGLQEAKVLVLRDIISRINPVEIVTPVNAAEVKNVWIESVKDNHFFYNPAFRYDLAALREVADNSKLLYSIKAHFEEYIVPESDADRALLSILYKRIDQAIIAAEIAASICIGDNKRTAELAQAIYGTPSATQTLRCYEILNDGISAPANAPKSRFSKTQQKKLKAMKFKAPDIADYFENALAYYGIEGWLVEVDDKYTAVDVRTRNSSGHPIVGIPTDREVNGLKLLELIGHEVESHLRSVQNAKQLFEDNLGSGSPLLPLAIILAKSDNELLDEGQAKLSDVSVSGESSAPTPHYTVAIDQARRGHNFRDVAETIYGLRIKNGDSVDRAAKLSWANTYRVFRGCTEPGISRGYAFTKDGIYFAGYEIAQDINPNLLNYASMELSELQMLIAANFMMLPSYTSRDYVGVVAQELLS